MTEKLKDVADTEVESLHVLPCGLLEAQMKSQGAEGRELRAPTAFAM